jgi:hypothetical protein
VTFANGHGTFQSALVTFARAEIQPSRVILHAEHGQAVIDFDPQRVDARLEALPQVDLMSGPCDLHRVLFSLRDPVRSGSIRLAISTTTNR